MSENVPSCVTLTAVGPTWGRVVVFAVVADDPPPPLRTMSQTTKAMASAIAMTAPIRSCGFCAHEETGGWFTATKG